MALPPLCGLVTREVDGVCVCRSPLRINICVPFGVSVFVLDLPRRFLRVGGLLVQACALAVCPHLRLVPVCEGRVPCVRLSGGSAGVGVSVLSPCVASARVSPPSPFRIRPLLAFVSLREDYQKWIAWGIGGFSVSRIRPVLAFVSLREDYQKWTAWGIGGWCVVAPPRRVFCL